MIICRANLGHNNDFVSIKIVLLDGFTKDDFGFAIGVHLREGGFPGAFSKESRMHGQLTFAVSKALIPAS